MKKLVKIENLDCAACAAELEEELSAIKGLNEVSVDFVTQRVSYDYETDEANDMAVYTISHFEEVRIVDGNAPQKKEKRLKEIISIVISACFFLPAFVLSFFESVNEWIGFGLYLASFAAAGWLVVWAAVRNLPKVFKNGFHPALLLDENLLMLVAAAGAFALRESMEGAIVMLLYDIGELLQSVAVASSRKSISSLAALKSVAAILIDGETQREVSADELKAGDMIFIRKGDKIPADCVLREGNALLDTKSLTGEPVFREVNAGEEMLAGCVSVGGVVKAEVVRPSSESAVQKILDLVENSASKKAAPEKFITRFARWYTPIVVLVALIVAVVPPLFQGYNFAQWIQTALNLLVISCPCALIISVPLTYFSGVGSLARCGVLAKGATYLDALSGVKAAAFDKTGTLTEGKFRVCRVNGERALLLAAAAERGSSHPLAEALREIDTPYNAENAEEIAGMGLRCTVEGKQILVGGARLMRENGVEFSEIEGVHAATYVAEEGVLVGSVEFEDSLKPDAKEALTALKKAGVGYIAVLTGDSKARAEAALKGLPVDEVCADLLPEEKPACAEKLKAHGALLYAGDGINDTPVMAASDVAVSMGSLGSDAAIEASDLVLASDNLSALPKAVKAAKKTHKIVTENIVFSIVVKVALMALSVAGFIPLWAAVLGDVGVMLLAVLNSMRMRRKIK